MNAPKPCDYDTCVFVKNLRDEVAKLKHEVSQKQKRENALVRENEHLRERLGKERDVHEALEGILFNIAHVVRRARYPFMYQREDKKP